MPAGTIKVLKSFVIKTPVQQYLTQEFSNLSRESAYDPKTAIWGNVGYLRYNVSES